MARITVSLNVVGNFELDAFKNLYAGYVISSLNPKMDNDCKRFYNEIGQQLYEQGANHSINMGDLHAEVIDFVNDPQQFERALSKFKTDINS